MRSYEQVTLDLFTFADDEDVTFNTINYYNDGRNTYTLTKLEE